MANELYLRKTIEKNVEPNLGQVGDVVSSMLTEAQLQSLRGSGWVLMDGRDVTGSTYAEITGSTTLPDARGQFLRGKNNGRTDGNEDPDGERGLGVWQEDAFQGHTHVSRMYSSSAAAGGVNTAKSDAGFLDRGLIGEAAEESYGAPRFGNETRPKNIAINYFVKIN